MKRFLLSIHILFTVIIASATGQDSDVIFIDGSRWELLGRPICLDSVLYHELKAVLPENRHIVSSNWDGFTAYWSIQQDMLCLDSIRCEHYNPDSKLVVGERIPPETLLRIFNKYVEGDRIVAGWLTGEVRLATGKVLYYQHMWFERNYEKEIIVNIDKGKVSGRKQYHNYVIDGFSFDKFHPKNNEELRKMFPLHLERYPELANAKRILFCIKKARVDAKGYLVDCEVKIVSPGENPRLVSEMAGLLKAYHPWKVSFINGEYQAKGIEGWVFPYMIEK